MDNLYITVSARATRPDLTIVARASTEDAALKMLRAGADRVVQPYAAAGQEMAKLMLKPQVSAFLDIVSRHGGPDLRFEEIEITAQLPAGRQDDPRHPHPPRDRRARRRAEEGGRHASTRRRTPTSSCSPATC